MEITGKIINILPETSGTSARGEWKKQDFILETQDQYPKKVCISNWNNKIDLNSLGKDAIITASINIESREFNEKWYTDVRIWKVETKGTGNTPSFDADNAPPPPPLPDEDLSPSDSEADDLPF